MQHYWGNGVVGGLSVGRVEAEATLEAMGGSPSTSDIVIHHGPAANRILIPNPGRLNVLVTALPPLTAR